jgi:hypothetical protein
MAGSQAAILINDLATDYEKLAERAEIKAQWEKAAIEWQAAQDWAAFHPRKHHCSFEDPAHHH